jgi:hypothetical protein
MLQVWDVASQQCQHTLTHHKGKVQAVAWNPAEAPVLLTGAFDKVAALVPLFPSPIPLLLENHTWRQYLLCRRSHCLAPFTA